MRPVEAHGHRGARGLRPENTLPGFACALELGVHALELDVILTADGTVIVHHDPIVSGENCRDTWPRQPDDPLFPYVGRAIRDLTLAQIKTLDAGRRQIDDDFAATQLPAPGSEPPTLAEVCELVDRYGAHDVWLCVELKSSPGDSEVEVERFTAAVTGVLDAYGMVERTRLLAFDWRVFDAAARLAPGADRVALVDDRIRTPGSPWPAGLDLADFHHDVVAAAMAAGATILSSERTLLSPSMLGREIPVAVWTVNDPKEMGWFIELGVDAIVTDYPDRLRTVMESYGLPLPLPCEPVLDSIL